MAWNKVFQNWTWHNKDEALDTPLSAQNLQKINNAIDTIDSRVVETGGLIADSDGTTLIDNDGDIELYAHDNLIDIHTDGDIDIVSGAEITLEAGSITIDADEVNADSLELNAGNFNINTTRGVVIDGDLGVTGGDLEVDGALSASGALSAGSANISGQASSVYFKSQAANSGGFASLAGGDGLTIKPESESDTLIPAKITKTGAQFYKNGNTYYIQLGEQGVKADKVKIGSDGTISGDGDAVFNNFNIVKYLPSPAANLTGKIFLLTEEDVDYGHGDLWECRLVNNQYKWRLCESELKKSVDNLTSAKADKVRNATAGHLAGLDANGNLTDSGVSPTEDVTVTGNPMTFDSPFEQDAKSVVVSVKPIQDLHGLPFPYAGGSSVNKMPAGEAKTVTESGVTITSDGHGRYTAKGTATADITCEFACEEAFTIPDGQTNTLGFMNNAAVNYQNLSFAFYNGSTRVDTWSLDSVNRKNHYSAMSGSNCTKYVLTITSGSVIDVEFSPMICVGDISAFPDTFSWYSNICPISGIDEVEIEVSGKNQLNYADFHRIDPDTQIQNNQWAVWDNYIACKENETVTVNCGIGNVTIYRFFARCYDAQKNFIGQVTATYIPSNNYTFTINVSGAKYFRFQLYHSSSLADYDFSHAQLEYGSEATDYEPYNPNSHTTTIPLPSTLYDADVDVTEGSGDNKGIILEFDGSDDELWELNGDSGVYIRVSGLDGNGDTICDKFASISKGEATRLQNGQYCFNNDGTALQFLLDGYKTVVAFKTWLSSNPIHVICKLATPTTISLTPTDVELLDGTNVVSTNAEKVAVTYGRSLWQNIDELKTDTEGKLDKSDVATIEGDTASRPYSVNEFMLRADGFYKVTAPIAQNASITSSNTTKTTIGAVLTALLNA